MTLQIKVVDTNFVHQVWPRVEGFIATAVASMDNFPEWSRNYNLEHIRMYVTSGEWYLFVAIDETGDIHGCATVSMVNCPLHRVAFITSTGGRFIATKEVFAQLKRILKELGATKIQGYGKDSIVRLWRRFDFEPRNTLFEVLI
jgi:hypothetical protein